MYFGVAMLGFPQFDEQWHVAYRLQNLNNFKLMQPDASPETIYEASIELIDETK